MVKKFMGGDARFRTYRLDMPQCRSTTEGKQTTIRGGLVFRQQCDFVREQFLGRTQTTFQALDGDIPIFEILHRQVDCFAHPKTMVRRQREHQPVL
jgi:hypothetical protein